MKRIPFGNWASPWCIITNHTQYYRAMSAKYIKDHPDEFSDCTIVDTEKSYIEALDRATVLNGMREIMES